MLTTKENRFGLIYSKSSLASSCCYMRRISSTYRNKFLFKAWGMLWAKAWNKSSTKKSFGLVSHLFKDRGTLIITHLINLISSLNTFSWFANNQYEFSQLYLNFPNFTWIFPTLTDRISWLSLFISNDWMRNHWLKNWMTNLNITKLTHKRGLHSAQHSTFELLLYILECIIKAYLYFAQR